MTDPRMTPTSDSPVTVEQQDRQLFARLFGVLPSASPMDQRALRDIARHRLAALASAPAGDGYGKWHRMLLDLVDAIHRDRGEKTQAIGIGLSYQQALAAALARPRAAVGERTVADSQRDFIAAIVAGATKGEPTIVEYAPDGSGWSVYDRAKHPVEFFGFAVDRVELAARVLWADGQTRLGQSVSDLPRTRTDFRNRARKLLAEHPALSLQSPLAKD